METLARRHLCAGGCGTTLGPAEGDRCAHCPPPDDAVTHRLAEIITSIDGWHNVAICECGYETAGYAEVDNAIFDLDDHIERR